MKKKLLTLLLAGVLALSVVACGGGTEEPKKEETKTEATKPEEPEKKDEPIAGKVDKVNVDCAEGTLTYKKHEVTNDHDGSPLLIVYFDYTNKKEESSYSQLTFNGQVFQNGVECDYYVTDITNDALDNATKEIQKDTTLEIAYMFKLQDNTNPVTLKVTDQSAENLMNNYYQEQELALQ